MAFAMMLLLPLLLAAQTANTVGPVPAQILPAKKVFVSNTGVDGTSLAVFKRDGESNKHYNHFYAAMKSWGHYELVSGPGDADLVFEIRFTAALTGCDKVSSYEPELELTILDAKTHFTLWTLLEPVQGAFRRATWDKNFNQGLANLMEDLRKLAQNKADEGQK